MANIMDFNSVWPLLRKEGWTWKPATGIQIHHNYLKPGRKIRGGKRGTDYFNGEDERLAYALRDTNLCTRQNIANVWVRPPSQAIQSTIGTEAPELLTQQSVASTTPAPPVSSVPTTPSPAVPALTATENKRAAPAPIKPSTKKRAKTTPAKKKIAKPKAATIKQNQKDEEAAKARSSRSSSRAVVVWQRIMLTRKAVLTLTRQEEKKTVFMRTLSDADPMPNVDVDGPADPDINGDGSSDEVSSSGGEGSVCHFDGSDNDDPDSEDEVEVRRDDDRVVLPRAADSVSEFQAIGRTGMEPSDPNLVLGTDEEFLDSDAEGSDDLVETAEGFVDDASSEAGDTNKSIAQEVSRMVSLMKRSEAAELHLRVQGSSDIYHNNQLTDMANDGWDVLPDDTTADVTDDAGADKMYDGYCGPSQGIIVAAKSPIELFFYLLPKALWRHIASESNRC
ncbi:hypothetical protein PI125_g23862 [Phytophthora idaei]|nr:hypothetical protein PI125_g23862 [Phytophthora idaei]